MFRCLPFVLAAVAVLAAPAHAQLEFEDPLGRFAITLPAGFEPLSEQNDMLFQFAGGNMRIILLVQDGVYDRATAFRQAAETFTGPSIPAPPEGAVFDLDVNGNAARWAFYPFEGTSGDKTLDMQMYLGAVTLEGADMSVAFMNILSQKVVDEWQPRINRAFQSIRIPGTPVLAAGELTPVSDALAAPATPVADVPASLFEHQLVTLDIPAGYRASAGSGYNIATIERDGIQAMRVIGARKNDFGKDRKAVLEALVSGVESAMPTARQTRAPREEATVGGDVVLIAEYEGTLVTDGREMVQWVLIASFKDKERGIGYMWMATPAQRDQALDDMLAVVRSTR